MSESVKELTEIIGAASRDMIAHAIEARMGVALS